MLQRRLDRLDLIEQPPLPDSGELPSLLSSTVAYTFTPIEPLDPAERHYRRGVKQLEHGNYRDGQHSLEVAIGLNSDYAKICCRRSEFYLNLGRHYAELEAQEYKTYTEADETAAHLWLYPVNRDYLDARYERDLARRRLDDCIKDRDHSYAQASAYLDAAASGRPPYADAHFHRGCARFNKEYIDHADRTDYAPEDWYPTWYEYQDEPARRSLSALEDFSEAIRLDPEHAGARKYRGIVMFEMNHHELALSDLNIAIRLDPNDAETYRHRSNAHRELGRYADAIADVDAAQRLSPCLFLLWEREQLNRLAEVAECDAAVRLRPNNPDNHLRLGHAKMELREWESAIADFDEVIRLSPENTEAFKHRGVAKLKLKRYAQFVADFNIAIERNPDDAELYRHRLAAKRRLGEPVTLLRAYESVGMQYCVPNDDRFEEDIAARRAHLLSLLEDYGNLIRLEPGNRTAYLYRGAVKLELGQHASAARDFDAALGLKPADLLACYKRAEALSKIVIADLEAADGDNRLRPYVDSLRRQICAVLNPDGLRLFRLLDLEDDPPDLLFPQ